MPMRNMALVVIMKIELCTAAVNILTVAVMSRDACILAQIFGGKQAQLFLRRWEEWCTALLLIIILAIMVLPLFFCINWMALLFTHCMVMFLLKIFLH